MHIKDKDSPKWTAILEAISLLADFKYEWAICGGWAVDLWLGEVTRAHKDVDILVRPENIDDLCNYLLFLEWEITIWTNGRIFAYYPGLSLGAAQSIWAKQKNGNLSKLPKLDIFPDESLLPQSCNYIHILGKKILILNLDQLIHHKENYGSSHFDDLDLERLERKSNMI